jgi:glutamyl/glutaminyl-tRNA synthetase
MSSSVRVRFAPSPTGFLHVGGARTALFNWLFARHHHGTLLLRIEDTDKSRERNRAVQVIYDGLRWLGLDWDEGAGIGGEYGPYFQSERNAIYEKYLNLLEAKGVVYEDEGSIRFRSLRKPVVVNDLVCGRIEFDRSMDPDLTIRRPDGSWIFHFVSVVDDLEMRISHVIRGEDHLTNTAKHVELYEALGATPPRFAHLPLILNRDGSKMSKRDEGASVTIEIEEVVQLFDLTKVHRRNAAFDLDKCYWLNGQYVLQMPLCRFRELSEPFIQKAGIIVTDEAYLLKVLEIVQEKIKLFKDVPNWIGYFFTEEFPFDPEAAQKTLNKPGALDRLIGLRDKYAGVEDWSVTNLEAVLKQLGSELGCKIGELVHPARVAVSGRSIGPSLYHMLEVMGKPRVLRRMDRALQKIAQG